MNRRYALGVIAAAVTALAGNVAAQTTKSIAGTYSPVRVEAYGDKPRGQMILTPDGRYVFIEINPSGQYGWIEQETGLPISSAICDFLMAGQGVRS